MGIPVMHVASTATTDQMTRLLEQHMDANEVNRGGWKITAMQYFFYLNQNMCSEVCHQLLVHKACCNIKSVNTLVAGYEKGMPVLASFGIPHPSPISDFSQQHRLLMDSKGD